MTDQLLKAAETEAVQLRAELEKIPVYQRLKTVEKFISDYTSLRLVPVQPLQGNISKVAKYGRQGSVSANVLEAAEAYLESINRRAMSSEIYEAIKSKVTVPGKTPTSTLSSYLSTSDLFDNVKGKGYGLSVWKTYQK
jgi:hypothetical protein